MFERKTPRSENADEQKTQQEGFKVSLAKEKQEPVVEQAPILQEAKPEPQPKKQLRGTWIEMSGMPSKGLAYPDGHKIRYRPYTYDEIDTVSNTTMTPREHYRMILDGIDTDGFPKEDLTLGDFLFIMLNRKITTMGTEEFVVHYTFNDTQQKHVMSVFDIEYDDIAAPELPIVLDTSNGQEVEFSPITIGKYLDYYEGVFGKVLPENKEGTALLALSVTNMDFADSYQLISTSTGEDAAWFKQIDQLLYHNLKDFRLPIKERIQNPDWSEDLDEEQKRFISQYQDVVKEWVDIEVTDDSMLLMPFRRTVKANRSGVRFGKGRSD